MSESSQLDAIDSLEVLPFPEPSPWRGPLSVAALWAGVLSLLATSVFAAMVVHGGSTADTPADAVQHLFTAVSNQDVIGVLEALPPSERNALQGGVVDLTKELQRLNVLSSNLDLRKVSGVDASFDNLKLDTTTIGDGVSSVSVQGGVAHLSATPNDLPLGDFVRKLTGQLPGATTQSKTITPGDNLKMVTIKEDGHWYVSIAYTIAEAARKGSGKPAPDFGHGLQAKGAASPEQAVTDMLNAGVSLDVQRLLELLPPDEARAVDDYAPLFLPEAKQAAADAAKQFHATIDDIGLTSDHNGDQATVHLTKLAASLTVGAIHGSFRTDGNCTDVTVQGVSKDVLAQVPGLKGGKGHLCQADATAAAKKALPFMPDLSQFHGGIVTVQRGGSWYVSPTRTFLGTLVGLLRVVQPGDLDKATQFFQQMTGSTASASAY